MKNLESIYNAVLDGDAAAAKSGVQAALGAGVPAETILKEGLIAAMTEVGRLFEANEYFVPEMLVAARAMQQGLGILKPQLAEGGATPMGKVVVGTVKGDLHDIGKNLVAMMLEGSGFEVIDLGTDVSPDKFVNAVKANKPNAIGMSALLTTTMPSMSTTVKALEEAGLRESVKVMVGGAPVTRDWVTTIGADGYSEDAIGAVMLAKQLLGVE